MKYILIFSILAAMLGGCVVVPYDDSRAGYYGERGQGTYRDRDYNRGDGYYRDYGYRGGYYNQGNPYRDHGN